MIDATCQRLTAVIQALRDGVPALTLELPGAKPEIVMERDLPRLRRMLLTHENQRFNRPERGLAP